MQTRNAAKWLSRIGIPTLLATTIVAGQAPGQQGTTFRSTTNYVSSDVIVKDRDGKFDPSLELKDFTVYEDGVPQVVTNFLKFIGGRALGAIAESAMPLAPVAEGIILPKAKAQSDASGRIFIIFIDDMHLQALDTPRVKDVLKQIRDNLIHENDLVGFVSSGYSSIATDVSYDYNHRRFDEAINKTMGSGMSPTEIITASNTAEGPSGIRYNAHVAFSTAYDLLDKASKITNRRKAFIYVSSGYSFNPFKDSRFKLEKERYGISDTQSSDQSGDGSSQNSQPLENPFEKNGQQFAESDLISQLAELTRAANRANVTFYAIDPRGLNAGPGIELNVGHEEWREWIQTTVSSLKVLSEETGGFCICEMNDFKKGIQMIDNQTSDYYLLGYTSNNPDPFKRRRSIKIEVNKPGLDLIYRSEYTIPPLKKDTPAKIKK